MIRTGDAFEDLKKAREEVTSTEGKWILQVVGCVLKIVVSVRRNTVKIMKKLEIDLDEPRTKEEATEATEDGIK